MFVGSARLPGSVFERWQFEGQFSGVQSGTWPVRGAALLAPLLATLVLQFFVGGLKGDHLAQIAIQQSLLVSPCKIGCVFEGHGHSYVPTTMYGLLVSLSLLRLYSFPSSGVISVKSRSVFMRATSLCTNWTGK